MSEKPHRKLAVWQKSMDLVVMVYETTRRFPAVERYGLASQMQRAAVSIPSNIAEGAARRSPKELLQFIYTARGSLSELDTQLDIALRLGYVSAEREAELRRRLEELSRMMYGLITSLTD